MKTFVFYFISFTLYGISILAQTGKPAYPQDYFRNPLDIPIFLAGNFGECRPGHFHSGTDIKTLGKENQPVHAAADGYISRIKMEKGGFGHGLYITHPNGYTTLYAHLNDFAPEIQEYVKRKQYEAKRWDVDLQFTPDQFPVKKGQQIAWSGNTGASTAPHLHFEIRNTKTEHPLNPELFGLPVIDQMPPVPTEVVLYMQDENHFYDAPRTAVKVGLKEGVYHPLSCSSSEYILKGDTILVQPSFAGIGISANDFMDGSDNTIAFYTAKVYMNDSMQSEVILDDIGYDETRYINAYADYKTKFEEDKWIQLLFRLPGNKLMQLYPYLNKNYGRLNLTRDEPHKISIELTDDRQNKTIIQFYARTLTGGLLDTLPKSKYCDYGDSSFYAYNHPHTFSAPNVNFTLDANELYENICMHFSASPYPAGYSDKYQVNDPWVPLHHYFELKIKPVKPIPFALRSKVVMKYSDGNDVDGRDAIPIENGWYRASVRNFGTYWLDVDTTAPAIKSLQKNNANLAKAKQITFVVTDNATSVHSFSGYLDGKWICFEQHANLFFYKFDEHCPPGKHKLIFSAADENGNERTFQLSFVR